MKKLLIWGILIPLLLFLNGFIYNIHDYISKTFAFYLYCCLISIFIFSSSIFIVFAGRPNPFKVNEDKRNHKDDSDSK